MATNAQQPVGPMARGANSLFRALSRNANPRPPTQEPGMLEATKTPNSGANPGTGASAVGQKPNPSYRGNNLNNSMLTGKSTELASRASTQREKENVGARRKSKKNFRTSQKSSRKFEKQTQAIERLKNNGLIVKYDRKTANLAEFVKTLVNNTKATVGNAKSVGNPNVAITGVRTEGADIDLKRALAVKRNDVVGTFMTREAVNKLEEQQWSETNENNIYKLYQLFVNAVGYFIDFSKVDPVNFKERAVNVPSWLGLKEFALRYSKPIVRYPGVLIQLLKDKDWTGFQRIGITNLIVKIKSLLFGYYEIKPLNNQSEFQKGIATQLKVRMFQNDETAEAAFKLVDSLVTCFKNANALTLAFNAVNSTKNKSSFNTDKLTAFKNITAEIGKIIESKTIKDNLAIALGYNTPKEVINDEMATSKITEQNADATIEGHKYDAN